MAEFDSAKELNIDLAEEYSTDVTTGDRDQRMYLYYQLVGSLRKAVSVDIIVSFLMESGVKMLLEELDNALNRGARIRILTGNYLGITQPSALYLIKRKLGDRVDLRFYNEKNRSFHPKSYIFHYVDHSEIYIGSSNVSKSALTSGIEWNYRFSSNTDQKNYDKFFKTFEDLFENHSIAIDDEELKRYSKNWHKPSVSKDLERYDIEEESEDTTVRLLYEPRGAQIEALCALEDTRSEGAKRALVQAATGVGKTYLAAFDSKDYERVLFVAHREEILKQAAVSFKNVRNTDDYGFFNGDQKCTDKSVIFASVATLGRQQYLNEKYFSKDYFDYIVIDEFHHAVNDQYRRIVDYFKPQFLLGLTATPERMDGRNIYEICDYNVPYEISLKDAINKGMLVPFHYYGIYDDTDYSKLHIVRGKYDEKELNETYIGSKIGKYLDQDETENFKKGRERGIQRLMSINLLKRMESSVHSFLLTVKRVYDYLNETSETIQQFVAGNDVTLDEMSDLSNAADDFDEDDQNTDFFHVGKKVQIDLDDMDYISWKRDIDEDIEQLQLLIMMVEDITPEYDYKLNQLLKVIRKKIEVPINPGNKKILIFTAFSDTAEYLYENVSVMAKKELGINTALITGAVDGKTTIPGFKAEMNRVLTCFSPISKERELVYPNEHANIDILIATDCISEGQNLQDCDCCINYDIHWNPVRIIQRFGRIDRIGSKNAVIQLVNFWPDLDLDEYINLKERVETRMKISVMTSTGDDDPINEDEKGDLEYRKTQLKRLREEVVDLEDMNSGISIMDLGLNEFRMDLLSYMKQHEDIDHVPFGIHTVVHGDKPGVIFVLKNVNENVNIDRQNRLHPFYLVYVGMDGNIIANHLQPKETLDIMRYLARGKDAPDMEACRKFNRDTKDGKDMEVISHLLQDVIGSIIDAKDEEDIDSFFSSGQTTFLTDAFSGLDDFELICFMVVIK